MLCGAGLRGVKRGAAGDTVDPPPSAQSSHGDSLTAPEITGPPNLLSRRPPRGRRGWWPALGPGHRGHGGSRAVTLIPAPQTSVTGASRGLLGPGAPHPNSRGVSAETSRSSPTTPTMTPGLAPRAAMTQWLLTAWLASRGRLFVLRKLL